MLSTWLLKYYHLRPIPFCQRLAIILSCFNIIVIELGICLFFKGFNTWPLFTLISSDVDLSALNESVNELVMAYRLSGVLCVACLVFLIINTLLLRYLSTKHSPPRRWANHQIVAVVLGLFYIPAYASSWRYLYQLRFSQAPESYFRYIELLLWGQYAYLFFVMLSCFFLLIGVKWLWYVGHNNLEN